MPSSGTAPVPHRQMPPGFVASARMRLATYIHPSFEKAERHGGELAVLRCMEQRVLAEFLLDCHRQGVDPGHLEDRQLYRRVEDVLKGMVRSSAPRHSTCVYESFSAMYEATRRQMVSLGAQVGDGHLLRLIEMLQILQTVTMERREYALIEDAAVREARVAASAYRVGGLPPQVVVQSLRTNTDVGHCTLVPHIEDAIEEDNIRSTAYGHHIAGARPSTAVANGHPALEATTSTPRSSAMG